MKLKYLHKHKRSSKGKTIALITAVVAMLAVLTFLGGFIDYLIGVKVMTYVMFIASFFAAYLIVKRCIFEYRYIYADDIFTVERLISDGEKVIFACDRSFIADVLPYAEFRSKYEGMSCRRLAFAPKEECTAIVYMSGEKQKAILIYVDEEFARGMKDALAQPPEQG